MGEILPNLFCPRSKSRAHRPSLALPPGLLHRSCRQDLPLGVRGDFPLELLVRSPIYFRTGYTSGLSWIPLFAESLCFQWASLSAGSYYVLSVRGIFCSSVGVADENGLGDAVFVCSDALFYSRNYVVPISPCPIRGPCPPLKKSADLVLETSPGCRADSRTLRLVSSPDGEEHGDIDELEYLFRRTECRKTNVPCGEELWGVIQIARDVDQCRLAGPVDYPVHKAVQSRWSPSDRTLSIRSPVCSLFLPCGKSWQLSVQYSAAGRAIHASSLLSGDANPEQHTREKPMVSCRPPHIRICLPV